MRVPCFPKPCYMFHHELGCGWRRGRGEMISPFQPHCEPQHRPSAGLPHFLPLPPSSAFPFPLSPLPFHSHNTCWTTVATDLIHLGHGEVQQDAPHHPSTAGCETVYNTLFWPVCENSETVCNTLLCLGLSELWNCVQYFVLASLSELCVQYFTLFRPV